MQRSETPAFALELLDNLMDEEGVDEIDLVICVVTTPEGSVMYRTNGSDADENIQALARAIGMESGYLS